MLAIENNIRVMVVETSTASWYLLSPIQHSIYKQSHRLPNISVTFGITTFDMRYEYFDCQLLSDWSIGPLQEFTTKCYALQDEGCCPCPITRIIKLTYLNAETVNKPGGTELIPTVTAFVPSLSAGLPFYVSIQSWIGTPQPTLQSSHIPVESIAWEARLFIDGKLVAHTEIGHEENWPITMEVRLRQRKNRP